MDEHTCPVCEGEATYLGALGNRIWFRCRNCGWDWTEDTDGEEED
jgi:ribosomal protein L37AE/L43A